MKPFLAWIASVAAAIALVLSVHFVAPAVTAFGLAQTFAARDCDRAGYCPPQQGATP